MTDMPVHVIQVDVVNETTMVTDKEIFDVMNAVQIQIVRDFAPVWGVNAQFNLIGRGQGLPRSDHWWLIVADSSDQAGALGYHDLGSGGLPLGKVFVKSTIDDGGQWSVTLSHEALEMLLDPGINMTVFHSNFMKKGPAIVAAEACDACESDDDGYDINGVQVSDFVYPAYFDGVSTMRFDHMGHLSAPFQILPGGYLPVMYLNSVVGWTQVDGPKLRGERKVADSDGIRPKVGSRRERRRIGTENWQLSDPKRVVA